MDTRASRVKVWLKSHGAAERSFSRALRNYFFDQSERLADAAENFPGITPDTVSAIFNPSAEHQLLRVLLRRNFGRIMVVGAAGELAAVEARTSAKAASDAFQELADQQLPQRTRDAIRAALEELERQPYWRQIQAQTEARLIELIQQAIDDKLSPYKLGMMIREGLGGMTANKRAQRIARTEVAGCMNAGACASMEELMAEGIITGKEWLAIADQDTRPDHLFLGGTVVSARADFSVGGFPAPYPGHWGLPAQQRIHCRCAVLSVLDPSITD